MIESCSKKRMLIAVLLLGGLTVLILILESYWTDGSHSHVVKHAKNASTSDSCWLREEYEVVKECHPCSDFEIASKSFLECLDTGYKETLFCKTSGRVFRGCEKVVWLEERKFWFLEGVLFGVSIFSCLVVYYRQRVLDKQMLQKIQRQLARGV